MRNAYKETTTRARLTLVCDNIVLSNVPPRRMTDSAPPADDDWFKITLIGSSALVEQPKCFGSMPPLVEASCRSVLNQLSTSFDDKIFKTEAEPPDVSVPYTVISRK